MAKMGSAMSPALEFRRLTGSNPFGDLYEFQRGLGRFLNEAFSAGAEAAPLSTWTPRADIHETTDAFHISLELAGINREDIKVNWENNQLTVSGERRFEKDVKEENYHRVERTFGQFFRAFSLPPNVNAEAINAEYKDGVLRLTLPKKEEAKPKQIQVKVS